MAQPAHPLHATFALPPRFALPPLFFFAAFAGGLSTTANAANVPGFTFPAGYTAFQYVFVLLQSAGSRPPSAASSPASRSRAISSRASRAGSCSPRRTGRPSCSGTRSRRSCACSTALMTAVAFAAGLHVLGGGIDLFGLCTLAIMNLAARLSATGVAMRLRTIQAGWLMQTPVFLVLFVSPVYVPLELLRGWIPAIAPLNPATYLLEAGRRLIAARPGQRRACLRPRRRPRGWLLALGGAWAAPRRGRGVKGGPTRGSDRESAGGSGVDGLREKRGGPQREPPLRSRRGLDLPRPSRPPDSRWLADAHRACPKRVNPASPQGPRTAVPILASGPLAQR